MLAVPLRALAALLTAVAVLATLLAVGAAPASAQVRTIEKGCPAGLLPSRFYDVFDDGPHTAAIDCVAFWGITRGTQPERYSPPAASTRGQMASFLARVVRASKAKVPASSPNAFDDDDGSVAERDIDLLAGLGIVAGRSERTYDPRGLVGRDQMATFLVRTYRYVSGRTLPAAPDAFGDDDDNSHEANIDKAAAAGFAAGVAPGRYAPSAVVRRDQMATFLARVLDALVEAGAATPPPVPVLDPACYDGEASAAACEFVLALQTGDRSTLSAQEKVAAAEATGFPPGRFVLETCELRGDVTVECDLRVDGLPANSDWQFSRVYLQPANGEYEPETGGVTVTPGEEFRYEVIAFEGVGLAVLTGDRQASGRETGRATLQHPTWGPVTVTTADDDAKGTQALSVVDAAGTVRFRRVWAWGTAEIGLNTPATDASGNLFVTYNPGRYDGVIVLRPVPYGFETFGSLPLAPDGYTPRGPFGYYAEALDRDGDRLLEIVQYDNDCRPSCAGGTITSQTFAWTGSSYQRR